MSEYSKTGIIKILMERDEIDRADAESLFDECAQEVQEAISKGDIEQVDDILLDILGLEMDYIEAFI